MASSSMPDIGALAVESSQPAQSQDSQSPIPNVIPRIPTNWKTPARQSPYWEPYEYGKWLASESKWKNRVGRGWVAKKVLGRGGFGIVGHWEYVGPDRDFKPLKDVVVKQATTLRAGGTKGPGLIEEGEFLQSFLSARTKHIVRIYRRVYRDLGAGTLSQDPAAEVHRMFLEFCPGGDLHDVWHKKKTAGELPFSEVQLWMIFHCLARALLVMHCGGENPHGNTNPRSKGEICHFDLKPGNILVGTPTTDDEHRDAPPFKIADFGMSEYVPKFQSPSYLNKRSWWGTDTFLLPEQLNTNFMQDPKIVRPWNKSRLRTSLVRDRRFGTASNVWQIGLIMHCLMHKKHQPEWQHMHVYNSAKSEYLKHTPGTLGNRQDMDEEGPSHSKLRGVYSIALRGVIAETLLVDPPSRIAARELVTRTKHGLEIARVVAGITGEPEPGFTKADEPLLDANWYSGQYQHPDYRAVQDILDKADAEAAESAERIRAHGKGKGKEKAANSTAPVTIPQLGQLPPDVVARNAQAAQAEQAARLARQNAEQAQNLQAEKDQKAKWADLKAKREREEQEHNAMKGVIQGPAAPRFNINMNPMAFGQAMAAQNLPGYLAAQRQAPTQPQVRSPPQIPPRPRHGPRAKAQAPARPQAQPLVKSPIQQPIQPPLPPRPKSPIPPPVLINMTFIIQTRGAFFGYGRPEHKHYALQDMPPTLTIGEVKRELERRSGVARGKLKVLGEVGDGDTVGWWAERRKIMRVDVI